MLKLKLERIDVYTGPEIRTFFAHEVVEYDELSNGVVIKLTTDTVHKYIGVGYHIVRVRGT